jgi:integrase
VAYVVSARLPGGGRTWTVVDGSYRTVMPVEEWLEAHRQVWSPNTVRGYATGLAQWWTFLEQRDETAGWDAVGVPAVSGFLSWLRNGRTVEHVIARDAEIAPSPETSEARLAALISFYRWHGSVSDVPVAGKLLRGRPRRAPARGLLSHLDSRSEAQPSSLVRVRTIKRSDRPPLLLPHQVQAIPDCCAVYDRQTGEWQGNLRDRFLFALLAETGMRLGEALGMRINEFVMGRGGTPYVQVVPREDNPNGARVKMLRPRRIYVGADLERLYADYLTHMACRAAEFGITISPNELLFRNLDRAPLLSPLREGTVRDKVSALKRRRIGPPAWTPHWFRHTHATALLISGTPEWVVSRRLGHARVQTTLDLYGWVGEDEALRAAANWKSYTDGWKATINAL